MILAIEKSILEKHMLKRWISSWLDETPHKQIPNQPIKLNLKKTLVALDHLKVKLEKELTGTQETPLIAEEIEKDCICDYGKWLYSIGQQQYSKTKEYKNALTAHTFFHQRAADVVYTHQAGNTKKAKKILNTGFKEASNLNQIELVRLYNMTIN